MFRKKIARIDVYPGTSLSKFWPILAELRRKKATFWEKVHFQFCYLPVGKKASQNSIQKKDDKVGNKSGYKRKGKGKEESKKKVRNRLAKKIQILVYTQARRTKTLHNFIQIAGHCTGLGANQLTFNMRAWGLGGF